METKDRLSVIPKKRISLKHSIPDDDEPETKLVIVDQQKNDDDEEPLEKPKEGGIEEEDDTGDFVLDLSSVRRRSADDGKNGKTGELVSSRHQFVDSYLLQAS